jgi:GTP cyclohydrolase II
VSAERTRPRLAGTLLALGARAIETPHGRFALHRFHDLESGQPLFALTLGEVSSGEPLLARVHSACATSEALGACDCDCAEQLDASLAALAREGRGALFYLMQEGRGAGLAAKARDRMWVQASGQRLTTFEAYERMGLPGDHRRYGAVRFALELLGARAPLRLLSNNPDKHAALEAEKVRIEELVPLHSGASPFNSHYLAAKSRSGHRLPSADASRAAALPAHVEPFEPFALPGAEQLVVLASYFLPVRIPGLREPLWFELYLHLDTASGRELIVLRLEKDAAAAPIEFLGRDVLVERFSGGGRDSQRSRWLAAASEMAQRGSGCAVFQPAEVECRGAREPELDSAAAALFEWYRKPRAARSR